MSDRSTIRPGDTSRLIQVRLNKQDWANLDDIAGGQFREIARFGRTQISCIIRYALHFTAQACRAKREGESHE